MKKKYDTIIIGAGIGGLICGCYLTKAGLKVLIIEQQNKPGGYCTSFERLGYKFDVGVHYLGGVRNGILGKILREVELKDKIKFHQFNPTDKIIMPDNMVYIYANPDETIESFKKNFKEKEKNVERFFRFIKDEKFINIRSKIKKLNFKQVLDSFFYDTNIKAALSMLLGNIGLPPTKIAALTGVILFKEFILDPGYYPENGMQYFSDSLARQFKKYGGELVLSRRVKNILIRNNKVTGVLVEKDEHVLATNIVSNIDAATTFVDLLRGESTKELSIVNKMVPSPSVFALYLGLKTNLKNFLKEPCNIWYSTTYDLENFFLKTRENIINNTIPALMISLPSMHNKLSLDNIGSITSFITAPYESVDFWNRYREAVSEKMIERIKKVIPINSNHIDIKINATPHTFEHYTSNKYGAAYGWAPTLEQSNPFLMPQQSSIDGLVLAGHWCTTGLGEGGISGVASLGRNAARIILARNKKEWEYPIFLL